MSEKVKKGFVRDPYALRTFRMSDNASEVNKASEGGTAVLMWDALVEERWKRLSRASGAFEPRRAYTRRYILELRPHTSIWDSEGCTKIASVHPHLAERVRREGTLISARWELRSQSTCLAGKPVDLLL
jgi:hypothetical protein